MFFLRDCSPFQFQVGDVDERNAQLRGFAGALGLVHVGVVEAAAAVRFVDCVHCVLELHALGGVVLGKQ